MAKQTELQQILNILTDPKGDIAEIKENCKQMKNHLIMLNGRVTKLEYTQENCPVNDIKNETDVVRFFSRKPKIFFFVISLIAVIIGVNSIELVFKLIKILT